MESEIFAIDSELMVRPSCFLMVGGPCSDNRCPQVGPGLALFDYIATCLHTFMERHELEGVNLPLGFTFSFPLVQVRH